jgi:O-antigen/teichoic acid export membrane protein
MLKSLVKDTAIYGTADFFFKLMNFAIFPIFAHLFSVEEFGVFSLATTVAALVSVIFNCGINNAVQRYYMDPQTTREEQPIFVTTGLISLVFFSFFVGLASLVVTHYFKDVIYERDRLPWTLIALAIIGTLPTQIFIFCADIIRIHFKPWLFTFLNALQNGLSIALSLFFVLSWKMGIEGYLLGVVLSFTFVSPLALWKIRGSLTPQFNWKKGKTLVAYGYPFIFSGIAFWIFSSMDRWMLAELGTATDVGIYSTAFKFGTILIFINTAFGRAWSPHALRIYNTEPGYKAAYSRLFSLWFFVLVVIGAAMSLFGKETLRVLTPSSYWPAANVIPFIAFGLVLCGTTQLTGIGISLERKTYHFTLATWLTAITNLILNFYFIPKWGAMGAAAATLAAYLVLTVYYLICSQWLHPLPLEWKKINICFLMIPFSILFCCVTQHFEMGVTEIIFKLSFFIMLIAIGGWFGIVQTSELLAIFKPLTVAKKQRVER